MINSRYITGHFLALVAITLINASSCLSQSKNKSTHNDIAQLIADVRKSLSAALPMVEQFERQALDLLNNEKDLVKADIASSLDLQLRRVVQQLSPPTPLAYQATAAFLERLGRLGFSKDGVSELQNTLERIIFEYGGSGGNCMPLVPMTRLIEFIDEGVYGQPYPAWWQVPGNIAQDYVALTIDASREEFSCPNNRFGLLLGRYASDCGFNESLPQTRIQGMLYRTGGNASSSEYWNTPIPVPPQTPAPSPLLLRLRDYSGFQIEVAQWSNSIPPGGPGFQHEIKLRVEYRCGVPTSYTEPSIYPIRLLNTIDDIHHKGPGVPTGSGDPERPDLEGLILDVRGHPSCQVTAVNGNKIEYSCELIDEGYPVGGQLQRVLAVPEVGGAYAAFIDEHASNNLFVHQATRTTTTGSSFNRIVMDPGNHEIPPHFGLAGDANCDGLVNNFDIDPWVYGLAQLGQPSGEQEYIETFFPGRATYGNACYNRIQSWGDINGDDSFNNFDIEGGPSGNGFMACLLTPMSRSTSSENPCCLNVPTEFTDHPCNQE